MPMLELNQALSAWDVALTCLVAVIWPIAGVVVHRRQKARLEKGQRYDRMAAYAQSVLVLWSFAFAVLGVLWLTGRGWATVGLTIETGLLAWIGLTLALAASAYLVFQAWTVARNGDARAAIRKDLEAVSGIARILPRTPNEHAAFKGLSLSAGITEEIIFRGYLIWAFSQIVPVWAASGLALIAFVLGHLYQDSLSGLLRVAGMGAVFTALYLLTGSLLAPVLLHCVVDLTSGSMTYRALREVEPADRLRAVTA